jgi:CubicO group peptidase (beta-lactamase class C family)
MRPKFVSATLLILSFAPGLIAETPTRHVLEQWLSAFNSADRVKLTSFWQSYNPEWTQIDRELHVRKESGGFTLLKVASDDGSNLDAIVADAGEAFLGVSVHLRSVDPIKVTSITIHGVTTSTEGLVPYFSNDSELVSGAVSKADALAASDQFSGSVLIARKEKILLQRAWGFADRSTHSPNTVDTEFCLGSMNKMFTAVAILQLVQAGKLSLDATLSEYWKDYPNQELARKVKVRELLNNTAGTGDIFTAEFNDHRLDIRTLDDYVRLYGRRSLEFEPGTRSRYSNYGFLLLGVLIEKLSGRSYYDYVREHIFVPAGMTHTDSQPEIDKVSSHAIGYMPGQHGWTPNTDTLPWRGTSAGGGYSTVGDLFRFSEALLGGRLIESKLLQQANTEQFPASHYGYGFIVDDGFFGHSGAAPGINSELRIYPESGYIVVALSNLEPPAAMRIAAFAGHRLPQQ